MSQTSPNTTPTVNKREYWSLQIEQWKSSKLSQQKFCQQAGINYTTFGYWRAALKSKIENGNEKKFVPVKVTTVNQANAEAPRAIQIRLLTGHVVFIPTTMDPKAIATLIHLLGKADA